MNHKEMGQKKIPNHTNWKGRKDENSLYDG